MIYLELFITFLKIGAFTFGGGYAMIPLIRSEVMSKNWMTDSDLSNFIAISESTPGPFALNISTYIGTEQAGMLGGLCATLGVVLPSFVIILIVARMYIAFCNNKYVVGCMSGLKPAVIGLISTAILSVGKSAFFKDGYSLDNVLSFHFLFLIIIFLIIGYLGIKKLNPILMILIAAALGILFGYFEKLVL